MHCAEGDPGPTAASTLLRRCGVAVVGVRRVIEILGQECSRNADRADVKTEQTSPNVTGGVED